MVPSTASTNRVNTDVAFIQTIHGTADHLMNSKTLLAMATAVAAIIAGFCAGALIRYRWSRQVIKLKQEEGWTFVARVNSVDFTHPWNNFAKPPEFRPSKFQWRSYEAAFTVRIAKLACP